MLWYVETQKNREAKTCCAKTRPKNYSRDKVICKPTRAHLPCHEGCSHIAREHQERNEGKFDLLLGSRGSSTSVKVDSCGVVRNPISTNTY